MKNNYVLGIETTCDETACAIVAEGNHILSNVITSQVDLHQLYGGVFPELACRRHIDTIIPVIETALQEARISFQEIDLIAVAKGPGLIGALFIGLNVAKALSMAWEIPWIGVNHVEAHLYAAMMSLENPPLPAIGVVVSGGHTFIVYVEELEKYTLLGATQDDAIGEAFDKVATLLGLPYPGGPAIEQLARDGNPQAYPFRAGRVKGRPLDFSFSGLKTNVLYTLKGANAQKNAPCLLADEQKKDVAASFQDVALQDIVTKTVLAAQTHPCQAIYIGGGVSQNNRLRSLFAAQNLSIPVYFPSPMLCSDNAAMIAGLGYHLYKRQGHGDPMTLSPMPRIPL